MKRPLSLWLVLSIAITACSDVFPPSYDYGTVEVLVQTRAGAGVPGVELTLYTGTHLLDLGTTDGYGRHTFRFVPLGDVGVQAIPPTGYRPLDPNTGFHTTFRSTESAVDTVQLTYVKLSSGDVEVRVVDPTGAGLEGVQVDLYRGEEQVLEMETNADGAALFEDLPHAFYAAFVHTPPGYIMPEGRSQSVGGLLVDEGWVERVTFVFDRWQGAIEVSVLDENVEPVSGVDLQLYTSLRVESSGETDALGWYRFAVSRAGDYGVLRESIPGYLDGPGQSWIDGIVLAHGDTVSIVFQLAGCRGSVTSRVVDQGGNGVRGAVVTLYTWEAIIRQAETDASGVHTFEKVPCGAGYGLRVDPPEGYAVAEGRGTSYYDGIQVEAGDQEFSFVVTGP